jgi:uncharacterized SAM-binding protein YcdF (DUF218 family)
MPRLRFRIVLILLVLILVVAAILFGLLTYWPDLNRSPSSNPGQGATGQIQRWAYTEGQGPVRHGSVDPLSPFVAGRGSYRQKVNL